MLLTWLKLRFSSLCFCCQAAIIHAVSLCLQLPLHNPSDIQRSWETVKLFPPQIWTHCFSTKRGSCCSDSSLLETHLLFTQTVLRTQCKYSKICYHSNNLSTIKPALNKQENIYLCHWICMKVQDTTRGQKPQKSTLWLRLEPRYMTVNFLIICLLNSQFTQEKHIFSLKGIVQTYLGNKLVSCRSEM